MSKAIDRFSFTRLENAYVFEGKHFPFSPNEHAAMARLEKHAAETIERRERIAGRPLSDSELRHGIANPVTVEDRPRAAITNAAYFSTPLTQRELAHDPLDDLPPVARAFAKREREKSSRDSIEALSQRFIDKETNKLSEAERRAAEQPKREAAREAARAAWELVQFSTHPQLASVRQAAVEAFTIAQHPQGDLAAASVRVGAAKAGIAAALATRKVEALKAIEELEGIIGDVKVPEPAPAPEPKPEPKTAELSFGDQVAATMKSHRMSKADAQWYVNYKNGTEETLGDE